MVSHANAPAMSKRSVRVQSKQCGEKMTEKKTKFKRKRLFVDNRVQGSLIRQLIIHWSLACFLIFLYLFTLEAFSSGFSLGFQETIGVLWREYGLLVLVLFVISPVFIYDSMKLSNRFVGPMISFRAALKKISNGEDHEAINFRQNDFWKELANDLNKVSAELKELRAQVAEQTPDNQGNAESANA